MGSVGNLVTTGLRCNLWIESGLLDADAFDIAPEQGIAGCMREYAEKFRNSAAVDLCRGT
jgi:hypothetical protein